MLHAALLAACLAAASAGIGYGDSGSPPPSPGTLSSVGGDGEEIPPVYRPKSQNYMISVPARPRAPHAHWEEETALTRAPDARNCLLCEAQDSGACRAMPSCVYCEPTVTALCDRGAPCLRCTVIKNPFFVCTPGEKYMDECDSCRCTDGRGGRCSHQHCEFRALHLYAMKLSDGEFY
ncbi:hypothetical protein JYU34_020235 [Plutella xylostella]|uniref:Pacifastin domain-containing protein n=1 Tax=Plutella xylostella TaxID=51655 RepID=A0ABQ7PU50_PLUXY|nr:uncharacterized protein LOC105387700 [Plutella xylostella]KAG7296487.1 hypothetical protein JYU34_020235 [Plutella xylostella]